MQIVLQKTRYTEDGFTILLNRKKEISIKSNTTSMIAIKSQIESVFIPQFEYLENNNRSDTINRLRKIKEKTRLRVFTLKKII